MLNLMTIRCDHCGQENNPQYRFCGSCGAPLQPAPLSGFEPRARTHEPETQHRRSAPVSGPSFLGLADESSRTSYEYLLDDEPQSRHALFYLILVLIVAGIAYGGWRWRSELYTLATRLAKRPAVSSAATADAPNAPDSSAGATAPAATPAPATPPPPNPSENTGETHSATATVEDGQPQAQPKAADSASTPEANAATPPKPAGTTQQKSEEAESPATASDGSVTPKEPKAEEPAVTAKSTPSARPTAKPAPTKAEATPTEPDREDRLVAEGERYLYGTGGVHEDCARAQRNLQIGARASNPKAYTLLGAMYATGHCVGRDLPTAYRWFARALHEQPSNTRLQQNLQVIWNQMTPSEKQIAANSRGQ